LANDPVGIKRGNIMKNKSKSASLSTRKQDTVYSGKDHRQSFWRRITMQLVAIFLVIVFLASECATILPIE
jgi:hypothetical protein